MQAFDGELKKHMAGIYPILTKLQGKIFDQILKGYNTDQIGIKLNKPQKIINNYKEKIKNRLSNFFQIEFENIEKAKDYYEKCFPLYIPAKKN